MSASLFAPAVDDRALALRMLQVIARNAEPVSAVTFIHEGQPVPKARARSTKAGFHYTPKHVVQAERDLAVMFQLHVRARPWNGPVALVALFFVVDQRRMDGDNLAKLVLDAATKAGVWHDDSQVIAQAAIVDFDPERPRTVIALAPATSNLKRVAKVQL